MTTAYAVVSSEFGTVSLWSNFDDAEAAAGELSAMDREDSYYVEEQPLFDLSWDPDCELP